MKPLLPRFFRFTGIFIGGGINFILVLIFPTPFHYIPMFLLGICGLEFFRELFWPRHDSLAQDAIDKLKG